MTTLRDLLVLLASIVLASSCTRNAPAPVSTSRTLASADADSQATREIAIERTILNRSFVLRQHHKIIGGKEVWSLQISGDGTTMSVGSAATTTPQVMGDTIAFGEYRIQITEQPREYLLNGTKISLEKGLYYSLGPKGILNVSLF